ncbi:vanillate O-demethylase ferredoxin subunit [Paraburkholderia sp. BL6669N2]|uniref:PDR/VanB family oxidoreductase n=1 Tax=Paraburkholderia sp. BL6669N2 TaxID=1938807 RepID=UPI000E2774B3|nr:PDR/VanB family oxidoreductase [Paraburkholderia sp. BL6669N2]REG49141.1 vanillate O-demethylase ferredoxin subunit [Paraburkholderia sp. BL6669N2]
MSISTMNGFDCKVDVDTMCLTVSEVVSLTGGTKLLRLRDMNGRILPRYEAGAHIEVKVTLPDGQQAWNAYSLIGNPADRSAFEIAIKREESGRGGSRYLHDVLSAGEILEARRPINGFSLDASATGHLLVAGGIGITPIYSLSCQLSRLKIKHRVIYCVRDLDDAPLLERLKQSAFADVECHADEGQAQRYYDFENLLRDPVDGQRIYVCGPEPFIRAISRICDRQQWNRGTVRSENFGGIRGVPNPKLTVHLAKRNKTIVVEQPETIVDAMVRNGLDPLYGCKRGECGICAVSVTSGTPLHRDTFLSEEEKKSEKYMCTCVSWSESKEITLDL